MEQVIELNGLIMQAKRFPDAAKRSFAITDSAQQAAALRALIDDYRTWVSRAFAAIPDDLRLRFQSVAQWQRWEGRPLGAVISHWESLLQHGPIVAKLRDWGDFTDLLDGQTDILSVARQRVFAPQSRVPREVRRALEHILRSRQLATIETLFRNSGCEPGWWMPPIRPERSERVTMARGWFDGILLYAPEREVALIQELVALMLEDTRLGAEQRQELSTIEQQLRQTTPVAPEPSPVALLAAFHPAVRAASEALVAGGHYDEAVMRACLALNDAVQVKASRTDLDGTSLMNMVFSPNRPILKVPAPQFEQQGVMQLMAGMWQALRNPRAHKVLAEAEEMDADSALEWLGFLSALFRVLDQSTL